MQKLSSEQLKDYIVKGKNTTLDFLRSYVDGEVNEAGEAAFSEAIEIGIYNTIACLYESNCKDEEIIRLLNDHWGISRDEAVDRIVYEKQKAPIRAIRNYLKLQGKTDSEIQHFMTEYNVPLRLKENDELGNLFSNPDKLYKMITKK